MTVMETLTGIFREVFDDPSLEIGPAMTAHDVEGWDSLSHVNLIVAVENRFKIRLSQRELLTLKNVGDLIRCIEVRLNPPAQA